MGLVIALVLALCYALTDLAFFKWTAVAFALLWVLAVLWSAFDS